MPMSTIISALNMAPDKWPGRVGHIDEAMMRETLPSPDDDTMVFLCGPPMMEFQLRKTLLAIGYDKKRLVIP